VRSLLVCLVVACAAAFASLLAPPALVAVGAEQAAAPPTIFIDVSVTDDAGRAVTTLRPEDLRVTVDGEARKVVSLRYVYRGPGADTAAALADRSRDAPAAAERTRSLLLLADENAILRGQQKPAAAVVGRMVDELGAADQAVVATLPRPPAELVLSTAPTGRQSAVARIQGRATSDALVTAQAPPQPAPDTTDQNAGARGSEADEQARLELERQAARDRRAAQEELTMEGGGTSPGASFRALRGIIDGLAGLPGLKSIVVFRQADAANDAAAPNGPNGLTSEVLVSSARARAIVHLVMVGQTGRKRTARDDEMAAIASATGGTITTAKNASDSKAFDGIHAALWGGYLVEVEGREGDRAARPHTVKVESPRQKTTVRAPGLWTARNDPVPSVSVAAPSSTPVTAASAPIPPAAAPPTATPPPDARAPRRSAVDDPQLTLLLARLSEYIAAYVRDFGNVVAEEDYVQRLIRGGSNQRHLKSDLLLVKTSDEVGWAQYRDVFEVDGRPVRDRQERVQKLFLENPADAPRLALEVSNEGARYNVGTLFRNINTPTLPLEYLSPKRIGGLSFWRDGEDTVEGIRVVKLAFEEMARPTMVQPDNGRADIPADGVYWVDPSTGRILKTRIVLTASRSEMTTTVSYKPAQNLGLWVPAEMSEKYNTPTEEIDGRAVYKNFRSFNVTTNVEIKK
jgi:hypothetical protein